MKQDHLIFRVIEYGLKKEYFTFSQLSRELNLPHNDKIYLWQSLTCWESYSTQNPNHILVAIQRKPTEGGNREISAKDYQYTLLPSAIVSYNEYLEIIEARKNSEIAKIQARKAHNISLLAIGISIIIGVVQIIFEVIRSK